MGSARRWFGNAALLPELRGPHDEILSVAAALRVVVSLTLGTVVLLFADDPSDPIIIGIAVAVFLTAPVALVFWRRRRAFPPAFSLRDVVALAAIASYEPEVRPMCMFFAFGAISYACVTLRPRAGRSGRRGGQRRHVRVGGDRARRQLAVVCAVVPDRGARRGRAGDRDRELAVACPLHQPGDHAGDGCAPVGEQARFDHPVPRRRRCDRHPPSPSGVLPHTRQLGHVAPPGGCPRRCGARRAPAQR
jgi:hypothetical protein